MRRHVCNFPLLFVLLFQEFGLSLPMWAPFLLSCTNMTDGGDKNSLHVRTHRHVADVGLQMVVEESESLSNRQLKNSHRHRRSSQLRSSSIACHGILAGIDPATAAQRWVSLGCTALLGRHGTICMQSEAKAATAFTGARCGRYYVLGKPSNWAFQLDAGKHEFIFLFLSSRSSVMSNSVHVQLTVITQLPLRFLPSYHWQQVEDWQTLPAGLEVRMPLDGGRPTARIPDPWRLQLWVDGPTRQHPSSQQSQQLIGKLGWFERPHSFSATIRHD